VDSLAEGVLLDGPDSVEREHRSRSVRKGPQGTAYPPAAQQCQDRDVVQHLLGSRERPQLVDQGRRDVDQPSVAEFIPFPEHTRHAHWTVSQ
jgi:hypothetical protein